MRRLDLKNYTYSMKDQRGVTQLLSYNFKDVLVNVLTHPSLGLNGPELLEIEPLSEKIENSNLEVILTDNDYDKIIDTIKRFRGFSKNDIQFVKRIYNCPAIPDNGNKIIELSEN